MDNDHDKLVELDVQVKRIVSDAESEKETRRRNNISLWQAIQEHGRQLSVLQRSFWICFGGGLVIMFLTGLFLRR